MEKLTKAQSKIGKAIEKRQDNFYKTSKSRKTLRYFRTQLELLEKEWSQFDAQHAEIQPFEASSPNHPYFEEDFFTEVQATYEDFKAELIHGIQVLESTGDDTAQASSGNYSQSEAGNNVQRKIRTQEALMSSLQRAITTLEEALKSPQSAAFYQQHLANLGNQWQVINTNHHEILAEEEKQQYDEAKYMTLESTYHSIAIKLLDLNNHATSNNFQPITYTSNPQSMVRLPKITIATFSGDYSKWTQFHDLFLNLIHLQPMSEWKKMFYLKSTLSGEPSRLIQHLQVSDANYKTAWDLLKNRYENKRLIVSALLNNILTLPTIVGESANTLKRLHDTVNEAILGIKNQGLDTSNWDALILHILLQKVDRDTHRLFEQNLESPREIPALNSFLKFVQSRFQLLETLGEKKEKYLNKDRDLKKSSAFLTTRNAALCTLCRKQHYSLRNCNTFLKLPTSERIKTAKQLQYCINCLKPGHSSTGCSSRGCLKCNARHNTLLHLEDQKNIKDIKQFQTQKPMERDSTVHAAFNKQLSSYVFLGTAMINIETSEG